MKIPDQDFDLKDFIQEKKIAIMYDNDNLPYRSVVGYEEAFRNLTYVNLTPYNIKIKLYTPFLSSPIMLRMKKNFDIKLPEIKLKTSEKDIFGSTPGIIPIEKEIGTLVENLPRKTNETLFIVMPEIKRLKFRKDLISPRIDSISNDTETLYSTGFVH